MITIEGNDILRDGEKVATFNPDTGVVLQLIPQPGPIKGQIRAALAPAEVKDFDVVTDEGEEVIPPAPEPEETVKDSLTVPVSTLKKSGPPDGKELGDKAPAVVEWYRDNDQAEYERRYMRPGDPRGPRYTHLNPRPRLS